MKKAYLLFSLLFTFSLAKAQFTSPNQGLHFSLNDLVTAGAATQTGSAYLISQDLTLEASDTLSISTNATIKLANDVRITIKGALLVNPPDSVKITADNPVNTFHTLRFENSTKTSRLHKTIVEYGSGVRVIDARLVMDSCVVRFNERVAQSGAINVSGAQPVTVTNSKIYRNARAGISTPANGGMLTIKNNWFFENGQEAGLHPQINLGPANSSDTIVITGNTIIGINVATNRSGGIAIANLLGSTNLTNFLIAGNTIRLNSYGVNVTGPYMKGYIKSNRLESNKVNPNANAGGSGINFFSSNGLQTIVVARNIIRDNLWGVTIQSGTTIKNGPKPSLGRIGSADTANVGLNQIYNNFNNGVSGQIWDLYNNTTDTIYAENNYWGTTNLTEIEDHIFHKVDSSLHGVVFFLPIMQSTGIAKANVSRSLSLYPNPAQNYVKIAANGMLLTPKTAVKFYNALGQEVLSVQPKTTGNSLEINTQKLAAGIYSYRIENNEALATGKLVISK